MKLSLSLALTFATATSAFALSPGKSVRSTSTSVQQPAFVRPSLSNHHGDASIELSKREMALRSTALASSSDSGAMSTRGGGGALSGIDIPLLCYFALWYLGNYYYNISNKLALKATGGAAGFPMTISALQLGIGSLYGIFLWLAPDARDKPKITLDDVSLYYFFDVLVHV